MSGHYEGSHQESVNSFVLMEGDQEVESVNSSSFGADSGSQSASSMSSASSQTLSPTNSSSRFRTDTSDYLTDSTDSKMLIPSFHPYRVGEIVPGLQWPKNLRDLMNTPTGKADEPIRKISVTEIAALMCHATFVEVGFVPVNCDLDPLTVCTMRDPERVERLGKQVDPNGYSSSAGVFTWSYRVVHLIREESSAAAKRDGEGDDSLSHTDPTAMKLDSEGAAGSVSESSLLSDEQNSSHDYCKHKYVYSLPCTMIAVSSGAKVQVFCNFSGSSETKPFQLKSQIDLQPFMETSIKDLEKMKTTPEAWMKCLNFNGTKFSSSFKSTFATLCLDSMNGIMFDLRGLVCLPPEILVQIFSYSDIHSIRNARLTCKYLNEVASIPTLWRTLIRRDFGRSPSIPAARFARVFSRIPYELSPNVEDAPHDYRSIHEAHRRHSFRARFDLVGGLANRLGARHSWLPYVTPPRPYLFRVAYDIPQLPSVHHPTNLYFHH